MAEEGYKPQEYTLRIFVCHDTQKVVVRPHVRDSAVHRADF